ncbi:MULTISPECIES: hypothetical protein [Vibrio]|uniref:Uncharacterized protein n=4 Tax=Vibrio TaxID=662 RepID=A0AAN0W0T0_9VIBR|nr:MULTISPECIES: hypothetical protein [Vibrio]CAH1588566.1 conserved hypothetical protein [Vibrio jasicida]AIW22358.1 hypothetical protein IX92_25135 [Vibrio coralliilyticus]KIF53288.1 hypothetical protein H735_10215 [Vibrio owensii CAIM 1854 = LMG 25443]MCZ2799013.1 hypothetical protein [Vibrio alginolyticus]PAW02428.1 hypothetical protein CKJ79_17340 [Vibrio coralliilyticus]
MAKAQQLTIGTKVKYYPIMGESECTEHEVRSEVWQVCGEDVVKISGKAGGVSIDHLVVIQ